MRILKESIIVAFAFVGVVVGAGFATGQEIFQFFTSHGVYSISGIIVTGLLITFRWNDCHAYRSSSKV